MQNWRQQTPAQRPGEPRPNVNAEFSVLIDSELDIVNARQKGRWLAQQIGFDGSDLTLLSTLISELARKVIAFDCKGSLVIETLQSGGKKGIAISISESRVGDHVRRQKIPRLMDRLTYDDRLLMLAGRHVTDEFELKPMGRQGAAVRVVKWLSSNEP